MLAENNASCVRPSAGLSMILYISGFAASCGRPSAGLSKILYISGFAASCGRPSAGFSKILYISGFAASFGRPSAVLSKIYGRRFPLQVKNPDFTRPTLLQGRPAGLRPDFQRFYILAASPRRSAGLRPDCQRFLGGGFRCRSKIQILLNPCYSM